MLTGYQPPASLEQNVRTSPGGMRWLRELPDLCERYLQRWQLTADLETGHGPWSGAAAIVLPVRCDDGSRAVLKLTFPHAEAREEADALELWNGQGAVRLLDADKADFVLLLERLDGDRSLLNVPLDEAVQAWGALVRRLSVRVPAEFRWEGFIQLAEAAEQWTDDLPAEWERLGRPFERWLLEAALEVCQVHGAVGRRSNNDVLVHSDLHYANILAKPGHTGDFVAIDPKPVVGDAEFSLAPMLWNRLRDVSTFEPERDLVKRLSMLSAAAGLDPELARQWSLVREVRNALGSYKDGRDDGSAMKSKHRRV